MSSVLTLVGDPAARDLNAAKVEAASEALAAAGAKRGEIAWLAPELAVDLHFTGLGHEAAMKAARGALNGVAVDLAAQHGKARRKRLLVADMDSTIVASETLDDLAANAGIADKIAPITARTMNGELPFEGSLKERVALLQGLPVSALDEVVGSLTLSPGARSLVRSLRAHGCYTVLCSGGFTFCTAPVAELCGFHEHHANTLLHAEGRLTGKVAEPILGRHAKVERLRSLMKARQLKPEEVVAVGDGANDIDLLCSVGLGVAYRGKPAVRAAARFHIDHSDLSALAYFQGLHESELVF